MGRYNSCFVVKELDYEGAVIKDMKSKVMILLVAFGVIIGGCGQSNPGQKSENKADAVEQTKAIDDTIYIGEYLDYDNQEPNLEIAKGEDGKYIVQIGIFRLATFDDGVGKLTEEGMLFTATDMAGNPISGIITVEDQIATIEFTNSTWELLETGSCFEYTKSSDVPNIWEE